MDESSVPTGIADLAEALETRRRELAKLTVGRSDDETVIAPGTPPIEVTELAWSHEDAIPDFRPPYRSFLKWCVAIMALLVTAAAVVWLGFDFYHDRETAQSSPTVSAASEPNETSTAPTVPSTSQTPTADTPEPLPAMSSSPPIHHEVPPSVANVNAQTIALFRSLLAADGLRDDTDPPAVISHEAQRICSDAAAGNLRTPTQYVHPDPGDTPPPGWAQNAVRDMIQAFCPQYAG